MGPPARPLAAGHAGTVAEGGCSPPGVPQPRGGLSPGAGAWVGVPPRAAAAACHFKDR